MHKNFHAPLLFMLRCSASWTGAHVQHLVSGYMLTPMLTGMTCAPQVTEQQRVSASSSPWWSSTIG